MQQILNNTAKAICIWYIIQTESQSYIEATREGIEKQESTKSVLRREPRPRAGTRGWAFTGLASPRRIDYQFRGLREHAQVPRIVMHEALVVRLILRGKEKKI